MIERERYTVPPFCVLPGELLSIRLTAEEDRLTWFVRLEHEGVLATGAISGIGLELANFPVEETFLEGLRRKIATWR